MDVLAVFPSRSIAQISGEGKEIGVEIVVRSGTAPNTVEKCRKISDLGNGLDLFSGSVNMQELELLISRIPGMEPFSRTLSTGILNRLRRKKFVPELMGIVNTTPDSFYPGSRISPGDTAALDAMIDEKPDIIDIGGESTRPGSLPVTVEVELARIKPAIEYVSSSTDIPISVDTTKPRVLEGVLDYNVKYANDISGFADPGMALLSSEHDLRYILMHMRGTPENMQQLSVYKDAVAEIMTFFYGKVAELTNFGLSLDQIIVDPGIGFAKTPETNIDLVRHISSLNMGLDLLVGTSRKSFMKKISGTEPERRLYGTLASSIYLMEHGVNILRLHDVSANREALKNYSMISGY
ncbi:dihydropteroate synthase [Thermoplasmatales archaeon]|nr:dihydropteroate synthase [Thermoplasmatales archaeon]